VLLLVNVALVASIIREKPAGVCARRSSGAKKGVLKVQKVCDEEEGLVLETDVAQLQLGLESFNIIFEGRVLPEESTLEACGLINNERLVLDFRWPWDAGDDGKDSSGKGKGDKKAPAKKKK